VKLTAFIGLGLETVRFLQGMMMMMMMMMLILMTRTTTTTTTTMNTSVSTATRRPTVEQLLPLSAEYQEFRPISKKVQSMTLNIRMTTMQQYCKPSRVRRYHSRRYLPRVVSERVTKQYSQP
jgi:hypothetical protein